jgi:transposase
MKPLSGNSEDQTGFRETLDAHLGQLNRDFKVQYYVFDSAGFVRETLLRLGETRWITRVPETITLARHISDAVAAELTETDTPIGTRSLGVEYAGIRQRWIVIRTASSRQRARKSIQREYVNKGQQEGKAFHQLRKQSFFCAADARAALEQFQATLSYTTLFDEKVIEVATYEKRGRPAANQPPSKITYQIDGQIGSLINDPHRQQKMDRKSCFIVATNELDETALSDEEVMEAYLKKQQKVERGFRFLKDPLFMASTVFLKSAKRIMALAMIMTLSLMVYSALEHRIRESLKAHQQTFPDQKGQPTDHPTARWVFQFFTGIHLLVIQSVHEVILNLKEAHQTLLALLGAHFVALYANSE